MQYLTLLRSPSIFTALKKDNVSRKKGALNQKGQNEAIRINKEEE